MQWNSNRSEGLSISGITLNHSWRVVKQESKVRLAVRDCTLRCAALRGGDADREKREKTEGEKARKIFSP
ncbi:hypothetical protein U1Q18_030308, partial [Sarracenia purpurea var. burkii]